MDTLTYKSLPKGTLQTIIGLVFATVGLSCHILDSFMTKESKTRQLLEAFKAADSNKDGFISEEELRIFFEASQIDESEVKPYMDLMDLTGDGQISLGEYKMMLGLSTFSVEKYSQHYDSPEVKDPYVKISPELVENNRANIRYRFGFKYGDYFILKTLIMISVRQIFDRLDVDGSGTITEDEIDGLAEEGVPSAMVEDIRQWLRKNDTNKDGKFDFSEFLGAVASQNI